MYNDLKFTHDVNINGEMVQQEVSTAQEYMQRAKCLSDDFQMLLQEARKGKMIVQEQAKCDTSIQKKHSMLELNIKAETTLLRAMGIAQAPNIIGFPTAELVHFDELNKQQLKAFIHVREFNSTTVPHGFGISNLKKSTVIACTNPLYNYLLRRAYKCHENPIRLLIDEEENNINNAVEEAHIVEEMNDNWEK